MKSFHNKVAVITGAGSGIGQALAVALAQQGARLALSDIDEAGLARTRALLPEQTDTRLYRLDVTDRAAVDAHAAQVINEFGAVHLLFNNAGSALLGTFANQTLEEARWLIDLNLWSVVYCSKAFLPQMLAQREGCIINISSIAGLIGLPAPEHLQPGQVRRARADRKPLVRTGRQRRQACLLHPGGIRTNIERASRRCAAAGAVETAWMPPTAILVTPPETCAADILHGTPQG